MSPLTVNLFLCTALFVLITPAAFGHDARLSVGAADLRFEYAISNNTITGYNLFVRQKPGMESVMLTERTGYYALRSTEWNVFNGYEARTISGVRLTDANSRFSIVSSTPVYDWQFGHAFHLFIPFVVVYGNPSASCGVVYMDITKGAHINIRAFDRKYADPNTSNYQNNHYYFNHPVDYYISGQRR